MVKGWRFRIGARIHNHKGVPAWYGLPVPKPVALQPGWFLWNVQRRRLILRTKSVSALVIGQRSLRVGDALQEYSEDYGCQKHSSVIHAVSLDSDHHSNSSKDTASRGSSKWMSTAPPALRSQLGDSSSANWPAASNSAYCTGVGIWG